MAAHLARQLAALPLYLAFWLLDEVIARGYRTVRIESPVFVVGQPRSGTTFLLRTLGRDDERFVSAQHLEWRYPSITFWRLLERLGLRERLERRSYWPATRLGKLAERIHAHTLGVHEELGIFLEEKFELHYFTFRRYPFPSVLERVTRYERLSPRERRRVVDEIERVMKKVMWHRRSPPDAFFLTKENEATQLHEDLLARFPDARVIFVARRADDVLASYRTMSLACTEVKHGLDPRSLDGWERANMAFRLEECRRFVDLATRRLARPDARSALVTYDELVGDVAGTIERVYAALGLDMSARLRRALARLAREQRTRAPGYVNDPYHDPRFDFLDRFVDAAAAGQVGAATPFPAPQETAAA